MPNTRTLFGTACWRNGFPLERLVAAANQRDTHYFVVAGDLFDKQTVTKLQVERAVRILASFEGEHILVLAGNHDYYEGPDNKLWRWFRSACEGTRVIPLCEPTTKDFDCDDWEGEKTCKRRMVEGRCFLRVLG